MLLLKTQKNNVFLGLFGGFHMEKIKKNKGSYINGKPARQKFSIGLSTRLFMVISFFFIFSTPISAQSDPSQLPLLHLTDFTYQGAFRLPDDTFGNSSLNYSQGPIEYNTDDHTVFIVGHTYQQSIAEFEVPDLVLSSEITDLNMAGPPLQEFSDILGKVSGGNPQNLNRIGGLEYIAGPSGTELIVNVYEYYDAPGDNTQTTCVVRDTGDISASDVDGFYIFRGGAGHTSGWISPIPSEWQALLGGSNITGQSSGIPIISRCSVGPSAFAFDSSDIVGTSSVPDPVPTTKLLDFSLANPLHDDLSNASLANDLWTHLSRAVYGFIVPGTRTYATIGYSGGHESGVCYKCTQNDGTLCGGYCAPDSEDYYHYYWLWDVKDLVSVKNGEMMSYDVRPYEYGEFPTPFETRYLGGGSFDPSSMQLYLTVQRADILQGPYSNPPVVVVYGFSTGLKGIASNFGKTGCTTCFGDYDGDGDVDGKDLHSYIGALL
jgi:hypothetical protein